VIYDSGSVFIGHLQTIYHHQGLNRYIHVASAQRKQIGHMGILKKKLSGKLVVFFIEGATGNKYADRHFRKFM
jgi:hypothetical protein